MPLWHRGIPPAGSGCGLSETTPTSSVKEEIVSIIAEMVYIISHTHYDVKPHHLYIKLRPPVYLPVVRRRCSPLPEAAVVGVGGVSL